MRSMGSSTQSELNCPPSWRWLLVLTAAATALRIFHLNSDLWLDEIGTLVSYVRLPISQIFRTYGSMNQHLLYSILAHISVRWFGESAWALRLPAALFGIASTAALYYTARAITTEREALLAAAFLTFSYHAIWFSQDARGYSAMVFFSLLGTGFLLRALANGGALYWVGYGTAMALGIISLQNTAFLLLGQWICCWWALGWRRSGYLQLSVASALALSIAAHSLMLREMLHFVLHANRTGLGFTGIGDMVPAVGIGLAAGLSLVGILVLVGVGLVGSYSYLRQTLLLSGIFVIPVILNFALLAILHIGAYPRSFLYELPFALIVFVRGLTVICRTVRMAHFENLFSVAILIIACIPLGRYYNLPKQDFTGALAYVNSRKEMGDIVASADLAAACYKRYYAPDIVMVDGVENIASLRPTGRRVWLLYSFPREFQLRKPALFAYIRTQMEHSATFQGTLGGGNIYVARSPTAEAEPRQAQ